MNNLLEQVFNKLKCPCCSSEEMGISGLKVFCRSCKKEYDIDNEILYFENGQNQDWDNIWPAKAIKKTVAKQKVVLKKESFLKVLYPILRLAEKNRRHYDFIIDVGSGAGGFSMAMQKIGATKKIILIDNSRNALLLTKKIFEHFKIENYLLVCADARNLPFKDNSFEAALSGGLLEHFPSKDQEKIIGEQRRVCRDIYCQAPLNNLSYWLMRFLVTVSNLGWPFKNEKPFNLKDLKKVFMSKECKIIDTDYHDFWSTIKIILAAKSSFLTPALKRGFLSKLTNHEVAILAERK